jgi:hypothetical protein
MTNPAYQRVTISVLQEHIDKGEKKSPCNCPIALAIKSQCRAISCIVSGDNENEFLLESRHKWVQFKLADLGKQFILDFDSDRPVKPFDFSIFIPLT